MVDKSVLMTGFSGMPNTTAEGKQGKGAPKKKSKKGKKK